MADLRAIMKKKRRESRVISACLLWGKKKKKNTREVPSMFLGVWIKINSALWTHENSILPTCLGLKLEIPGTDKSGTSVRARSLN